MSNHPQTKFTIKTITCDQEIKYLIQWLNSLDGIWTKYSCQGGIDYLQKITAEVITNINKTNPINPIPEKTLALEPINPPQAILTPAYVSFHSYNDNSLTLICEQLENAYNAQFLEKPVNCIVDANKYFRFENPEDNPIHSTLHRLVAGNVKAIPRYDLTFDPCWQALSFQDYLNFKFDIKHDNRKEYDPKLICQQYKQHFADLLLNPNNPNNPNIDPIKH